MRISDWSSDVCSSDLARSVAWRGLCSVTGAWAIRGFSMFSAVEKASGRWIGRLGPWQPEGWPGTEVGWALVRDVWGRGYENGIASCRESMWQYVEVPVVSVSLKHKPRNSHNHT